MTLNLSHAMKDALRKFAALPHVAYYVIPYTTRLALMNRGLIVKIRQDEDYEGPVRFALTDAGRAALEQIAPQQNNTSDDSALLGPIPISGQNVNDFFARAAASVADTPAPLQIDVSWMRQTVSADEADAMIAGMNAAIEAKFGSSEDDDDDTPSFEDAIADMATAWRDAATDTQILVRDASGALVPFVDEPLPSDSDHDAVMFLTEEEADFMRNVCLFDGLLVYPHQRAEIIMAAKLEQGGLVTVQRADGYVIVSAVRPDEGE